LIEIRDSPCIAGENEIASEYLLIPRDSALFRP